MAFPSTDGGAGPAEFVGAAAGWLHEETNRRHSNDADVMRIRAD
jgi:hypothetical protein